MALLNLSQFKELFTKPQKLQFIFSSPLTNADGYFEPTPGVVEVDATTQERYTLTAGITQNPIESGATLSDHIHIQPQTLTIQGIITDRPLDFVSGVARVAVRPFLTATRRALLDPFIGGYTKHLLIAGTGLIAREVLNAEDRSQLNSIYWQNFLKKRFNEKKLFRVRTEVDELPNVFFQSVTWDRQRSHGDALVFTAVIQEVQTVGSDIISTSRRPDTQKTASLGRVSAEIIQQDDSNEEGRQIIQNTQDIVRDQITEKPNILFEEAKSALKRTEKAVKDSILNFFQ